MAVCEITGKGKMYGHNVSFSQRKTRKVFKPNVQKRTLIINGEKIRANVSASALRALKKKGLLSSSKPSTKA
ncbi:50S ribosomal protein L28 [Candidatus Saccharibacteria bacterium]|nr:50S ribosomal protein L28 [Candidatus Saccharibacteria bacterium]